MYELWLRSFHAVARHGGATAAADALGLSQPTVTEQVKALEGRFQVELFHRHGRRMTLTALGRSLYQITQDIAGHTEEAIRLLQSAEQGPVGPFTIGSANPYYVMELIQLFGDRFPGLTPSLEVKSRAEVIAGLLDFRYDAVMFGRVENDARILNLPYQRHRVLILVPLTHPFAKRRQLRMRELEGQPFVFREGRSTARARFETALSAAGVGVRQVMVLDSREAIREAVALGIGFGYVAEGELLPADRVRAIPVKDAEMWIDSHIACLRSRAERPLVRAFLETAQSMANWQG
jgi:aminoethylphosphonate catabolism LysR family transcriptional regulator